jgi:hypothetical protein
MCKHNDLDGWLLEFHCVGLMVFMMKPTWRIGTPALTEMTSTNWYPRNVTPNAGYEATQVLRQRTKPRRVSRAQTLQLFLAATSTRTVGATRGMNRKLEFN